MAINKTTQYTTNPKTIPIYFNNIQELEDYDFLNIGDIVETLGYTSLGDGGGNDYEIVASGTGTVDGISYIDLSSSGHQAALIPGGSLTIYVDASGNDSNSGFNESSPVASIKKAAEIAVNHNFEVYNIIIAAGSYEPGAFFRYIKSDASISPRIFIKGEPTSKSSGEVYIELDDVTGTFQVGETVTGGTSGSTGVVSEVGNLFFVVDASGELDLEETVTGGTSGAAATVFGVSAVPTTIIDGALSADENGITVDSCSNVEIIDIKCQNMPENDRSGILTTGPGLLTITNYHSKDCYRGLFALTNTSYIMRRSVLRDGNRGVHELFGTIRSFVGNAADKNIIRGFTWGVFSKEHCTGHLDFASITNCDTGIFASRSVTYNASDARLVSNNRPFVLRNGSFIVPLRIDFGFGTTDENDEPWYVDATSAFVSNESGAEQPDKFPVSERIIGFRCPATADSHTGDTNEHIFPVVTSHRAGNLYREGMYYRASVHARKIGGGGTAMVSMKWGSADTASLTIPAGMVGYMNFEIVLIATSSNSQLAYGKVVSAGDSAVARNTRAFNPAADDQGLAISVTLSDSADTFEVESVHIYGLEAPEQGT